VLPKSVAESIPLKQGLKPQSGFWHDYCMRVAESIPLKQGLKHFSQDIFQDDILSCGEHSIKTRIETSSHIIPWLALLLLRRAFH